MLKKTGILILVILITIPLIFAIDTSIIIKAKTGYEISVNVLDPSSKDSIYYNSSKVENSGQVNFSLSTDRRLVDLVITVRNNGKIVEGFKYKEFPNQFTSSSIIINLNEQPKPSPVATPVIEKNETQNISQNTSTSENLTAANATTTADTSSVASTPANETKQETNQNSSTTGFIINFSKITSKINWKIIIYPIIAIIVLVLLVFGYKYLQKRRKSWGPSYKFLVKPKTSLKVNFAEERALMEAEEKIKRAQEEIERIKSRDRRIKEAEKKLEQDRLELERLKRRY